jgi:hypothetical protein
MLVNLPIHAIIAAEISLDLAINGTEVHRRVSHQWSEAKRKRLYPPLPDTARGRTRVRREHAFGARYRASNRSFQKWREERGVSGSSHSVWLLGSTDQEPEPMQCPVQMLPSMLDLKQRCRKQSVRCNFNRVRRDLLSCHPPATCRESA